MARQEVVSYSYSCDICGKDADGSQKVAYGNGTRPAIYELDLCASDAKKLAKAQDALVALLARGRKSAWSRQRFVSAGRPGAKRSSTESDPAAIRAWAVQQGYEVSERGRISAALREAYAGAK